MHISCPRHLGLKNDQAIVVTLEIRSKIANVLSASKLLLEECSCAQLCLLLSLEYGQSDHSSCVLVMELCVHMYFPGCWFTRLGGYLFSNLWMTVKIYAPESEARVSHLLGPWKPPFSVTQAVVVIQLAPCLEQAVWLSDSCNQSMELETKKS